MSFIGPSLVLLAADMDQPSDLRVPSGGREDPSVPESRQTPRKRYLQALREAFGFASVRKVETFLYGALSGVLLSILIVALSR